MNELVFFSHLLIIVGLTFGAVRLGKEALMTLIALFAVLANLFIVKETTLFGFNVTCTDSYAVGSMLALNLLQQYYGKKEAQKCVNRSFFIMAAFAILAIWQLLYYPGQYDSAHGAFVTVLTNSPRIVAASLFTFYVVQRFDVFFFAYLRKTAPGTPLYILLTTSLVISQLIDTVMFSFLGLYGVIHSMWDIIVVSMAMKCLAILFMAPLATLSKKVRAHD